MISVIIVNYNGEKLISRCLRSLTQQDFMDTEIIVVDNASKDQSVSLIRREYPFVKLIESPVNAGFAGGNLIGLKVAKGSYIALFENGGHEILDFFIGDRFT